MKRYTDEDVARLVKNVNEVMAAAEASTQAWVRWKPLKDALAPFLPDPEDALIEQMAQAMNDRLKVAGGMGKDWHRVTARAALDVVKREGLPT